MSNKWQPKQPGGGGRRRGPPGGRPQQQHQQPQQQPRKPANATSTATSALSDEEDTRIVTPRDTYHVGAHVPTKTSIGVLLCRTNTTSLRLEVLLVHKRYTYAFAEFVHGRYPRGRDNGSQSSQNAALRSAAALFDQMTLEELLDVYSLDFGQLWYRIWLTRDGRELYNKKFAKFHSAFIRDDGGVALRAAILAARSHGTLLWEVPKGRRQNPRESDILCAVRELREETGIEKSDYRFLPGIKRRVSYVSSGTRYTCTYYVAVANPRLSEHAFNDRSRPTLRDINHMGEVGEIGWHDIERIRMIDGPEHRLENLIDPTLRIVKRYKKGRWTSRRPVIPVPSFFIDGPALVANAVAAKATGETASTEDDDAVDVSADEKGALAAPAEVVAIAKYRRRRPKNKKTPTPRMPRSIQMALAAQVAAAPKIGSPRAAAPPKVIPSPRARGSGANVQGK